MRPLLLGPLSAGSRTADLGLLLLRVFAGLALALAHGMGKMPPSGGFVTRVGELGFPAPVVFAWLAGLAEFGGGLLLALGFFTRASALFIAGNFLLITVVAHAGDSFGDREKPALFLAIALLYLLAGPGRYSLDYRFFERRRS